MDYGQRKCLVCGKFFTALKPSSITCSAECMKKRKAQRTKESKEKIIERNKAYLQKLSEERDNLLLENLELKKQLGLLKAQTKEQSKEVEAVSTEAYPISATIQQSEKQQEVPVASVNDESKQVPHSIAEKKDVPIKENTTIKKDLTLHIRKRIFEGEHNFTHVIFPLSVIKSLNVPGYDSVFVPKLSNNQRELAISLSRQNPPEIKIVIKGSDGASYDGETSVSFDVIIDETALTLDRVVVISGLLCMGNCNGTSKQIISKNFSLSAPCREDAFKKEEKALKKPSPFISKKFRICERCGKSYMPRGNRQRFCSETCQRKH